MPTKTKTPPKRTATLAERPIPMPLDSGVPLTMVDVKRIRPSPFQTRDGGPSSEFIATIADDGLQDPPTVRPVEPNEKFPKCDLEMVKGHLRLYAIIKTGAKEIPVYIREMDDDTAYRQCVIENLQRQDLNPVEEARAFGLARDRFGWTQAKIAGTFHRTAEYVKGRLELLDMPDELRVLVNAGLELGKAKLLIPLGQFRRMEGGGPDLIGKIDLDDLRTVRVADVKGWVERIVAANAVPIKGWDKTICEENGCLGSFAGRPFCLRPTHAFKIAVDMAEEKIEKGRLAALTMIGLEAKDVEQLPVFYDLTALAPRADRYSRPITNEQPKGHLPFPLPLYDGPYRNQHWGAEDGPKFARSLKEISGMATAVQFDECRTCPAFDGSGKQDRARAVYVQVGQDPYSDKMFAAANVVCMAFAGRKGKIKDRQDSRAGGVESTKGPSAVAIAREKAQPTMREHVDRLVQKLTDDPARLLATAMMNRGAMSELPHVQARFKDAATILGMTIPEGDGTPNGAFKALMSLGEAKLRRVMALGFVHNLDRAGVKAWDKTEVEWYPRRLAETARVLYGDPVADEIKADAKRVSKVEEPSVKPKPAPKAPPAKRKKPAAGKKKAAK